MSTKQINKCVLIKVNDSGATLPPRHQEEKSKRVKDGHQSSRVDSSKHLQLRTTSVIFVEFSRRGELQKLVSEQVNRLAPMQGFRMRVQRDEAQA